jgi:hypothetical protein
MNVTLTPPIIALSGAKLIAQTRENQKKKKKDWRERKDCRLLPVCWSVVKPNSPMLNANEATLDVFFDNLAILTTILGQRHTTDCSTAVETNAVQQLG